MFSESEKFLINRVQHVVLVGIDPESDVAAGSLSNEPWTPPPTLFLAVPFHRRWIQKYPGWTEQELMLQRGDS